MLVDLINGGPHGAARHLFRAWGRVARKRRITPIGPAPSAAPVGSNPPYELNISPAAPIFIASDCCDARSTLALGQGRLWPRRRMAQPVYPQLRNTPAFRHLRFVPIADVDF